ncbi:MAG: hypothetical protein V9F01_07810 [Chitinophagaceae bacterium]
MEGPMKVIGGNNQSVSLAAKSEGRAIFKVVADPTINVGKVTVTVSGMGEKFTDATEISVRPPSTLQKVNRKRFNSRWQYTESEYRSE